MWFTICLCIVLAQAVLIPTACVVCSPCAFSQSSPSSFYFPSSLNLLIFLCCVGGEWWFFKVLIIIASNKREENLGFAYSLEDFILRKESTMYWPHHWCYHHHLRTFCAVDFDHHFSSCIFVYILFVSLILFSLSYTDPSSNFTSYHHLFRGNPIISMVKGSITPPCEIVNSLRKEEYPRFHTKPLFMILGDLHEPGEYWFYLVYYFLILIYWLSCML